MIFCTRLLLKMKLELSATLLKPKDSLNCGVLSPFAKKNQNQEFSQQIIALVFFGHKHIILIEYLAQWET